MIQVRTNEEGKQFIGTFFDVDSPLAMECVALSGLDFAIIDLEHAPLDISCAVELICRAHLHHMSVLIRPADFSRPSILKALDAGADGLVVPSIYTIEDAKQVVRYGKYKPIGDRGVAYTRACNYGCDPRISSLSDLFEIKNNDTKLYLQCETASCLEHIDEIVACDGVDGIFIGPYDLTSDMNFPGQFSHQIIVDALKRVYMTCRKHNKSILIFAPTLEDMKLRLSQGYDAVAVTTVTNTIRRGYEQILKII